MNCHNSEEAPWPRPVMHANAGVSAHERMAHLGAAAQDNSKHFLHKEIYGERQISSKHLHTS